MIAGSVIYYQSITGAENDNQTLFGVANQTVADAFSSVRTIHAYNLQDRVSDLYR